MLTWWHAVAPEGARRVEKTELLQRLARLLADGEARSALRLICAELWAAGAATREQWFGGVTTSAPYGGARAERSDQLEPLRAALRLAIESGRLVGYEIGAAGGGAGGTGVGKPHGPPKIDLPPPEITKTIPPYVPPHKPVEPSKVHTVAILSKTITSDHGVMMGQVMLWLNTGTPYPEPEWTPAMTQPVSHTRGKPVTVRLELVIGPEGAASDHGVIRGKGPDGLTFETPPMVLAPGPMTVEVTSAGLLPNRVQAMSFTVQWTVELLGQNKLASVTPATTAVPMYLTFGKPKDELKGTGEPNLKAVGAATWLMSHLRAREDGVTLKRMAGAVDWVESVENQDDLHDVARQVVLKVPGYTLEPNWDDVPLLYNHPTYYNGVGAAWPLWEFAPYKAECQAIARLARAVLRQLGAPVEARVVRVWVEPVGEDDVVVVEADWEEVPDAGLDTTREVNGVTQVATLVANPVQEGEVHTIMSAGANRFEACLCVKADGQERYYPGGVPGIQEGYLEPDEVMDCFWGLVWVEDIDENTFRVEKIVKAWAWHF